MVKHLVRHGNSLALIIDKPILELLHIDAKTPLNIATDGRALVISAASDRGRRKKLHKGIEKFSDKYAGMLKNLAD